MIALPYILLLLFLAVFVLDAKKGILIAVMIRPIIDCFYDNSYAFAGIKPTEYFGFLLPTLVCIKILLSRENSFFHAPLAKLWIIYLYTQLFSIMLIITVRNDGLLGMNYFFRALNGFIGFYIFQEFFRTRKEFQVLLVAHLLAGFIPLGMSFYQNLLGGTIRSEATIGGLVRNIGYYHDAYSLRFYCFQTLAAIVLYWNYFLSGIRIAFRSILLILSGVIGLTIYKIYSKAGYLIIVEWLIVWNIVRKKFLQLVVVVSVILILIAISVAMQPKLLSTLGTTYSKEFGAIQGKEKTDRLFQGRVGVWRIELKEFTTNPLYMLLLGDGSPHTDAHNDFLRALMGTGIIGLILYLLLLGGIGIRTLQNCWRNNSALNTIAIILIGMWLIDAMGLVPGAYPGYQIFVWGFIGLALRGVEGLDVSTKQLAVDA